MAGVIEWASNLVYGAGHGAFTGQPTKVDPGASIQADGIVPGEAVGSQHINYVLNEITKNLLGINTRELEFVKVPQVVTFSDTAGFEVLHATEPLGGGDHFCLVSGDTAYELYSSPDIVDGSAETFDDPDAITPLLFRAATDGVTVFCTTNSPLGHEVRNFTGAFLTASAVVPGGSMVSVNYSSDDTAMVISTGGGSLFKMIGADYLTAFVLESAVATTGDNGIASIAGGAVLATRKSGDINQVLDVDTSGGAGSTIVGALPTISGGSITGDLVATSQFFFWAQVEDDGGADVVVVYRSTNGVSWEAVQTFSTDVGSLVTSIRQQADLYSNATYIEFAVDTGGGVGGTLVSLSKDQGVSWSDTVRHTAQTNDFSAAGGYLWNVAEDQLFRTSLRLPKAV